MSSANNSSGPAVSVIVPCYKQAHFLFESVGSVLAQTYANWECIIVDDGSPDDAAQVAQALIDRHPHRRIRLVRQANQGLSCARNNGIRASRGRYILPLDSDDILAPQMLEKTVALLESNGNLSVAYSDIQFFGTKNELCKTGIFELDPILRDNQLAYCSLYRRAVWDAVGGYDSQRAAGHARTDYDVDGYKDWEFWIHAIKRGFRGGKISEPLFRYRVAATSMVTACDANRPKMTASIVLNHPGLYSAEQRKEARAILQDEARPSSGGSAKPAISVVVTTRGAPEDLSASLQIVLAQSLQDLEVIVVNHSANATGAELESTVARLDAGAKTTYLRTPDRGLAAARNLGARAARGVHLAYLDDGESWTPDHLRALLGGVRKSGKPIAYCDARDGKSLARAFDPQAILLDPFIPAVSMLLQKNCLEEIGWFDESLGALADWDCAIRLSQRFSFQRVPESSCSIRLHANDIDASRARLEFHSAQVIQHKHRQLFEQSPVARNVLYNRRMIPVKAALDQGQIEPALRLLQRVIAADPTYAEAHNDLAVLCFGLKRLDEAERAAQQSLELDPFSATAKENQRAIRLAISARDAKKANAHEAARPEKSSKPILAIAFSRDRQMQLDATLRSLKLCWQDAGDADVKVLFKATNENHRALYQQLQSEHPDVELIAETDFRAQLLALLPRYRFVLFLVDDNLFVQPFQLGLAAQLLAKEPTILGASLRLGRNTTYCYSMRSEQRVPTMAASAASGINRFRWVGAEHDFGYPLEVSSSLYRAPDMAALLGKIPFRNPNELEAEMANRSQAISAIAPDLLCFERSVTFCNPINMVQTVFRENRAGAAEEYSPATLARQFAEGFRVRVDAYRNLLPKAAHQEAPLELERR